MNILIKKLFGLDAFRKPAKREKRTTTTTKFFIAESEKVLSRSKAAAKTVSNSHTALRSLKRFLDGDDIALSRLSSQLICRYERWLLDDEGVSENTAALYMRSLRALYNKVSGKKRTDIFSDVRTNANSSHSIEDIPVSEIRKIAAFHSSNAFLQQACDVFMFSFYCMGMPFIDVFSLEKSQIHGGTLTYRRHKTGVQVTVALTAAAKSILRKYSQSGSRYVFPFEQKGKRMCYATALRLYNRNLKQLETTLSLKKHLSSYVARHTWATLAYSETCDMNIVAGALGHTSTKVTMTYVTFIQNKKLDATNRKIIKKIYSPAYCDRGGRSCEFR